MRRTNRTDSTESTDRTTPSRRRFLRATAATGAITGFSGLASAQATSQTFRLGGEMSGWQGIAPQSIAGETNPTLYLDTGTKYRVVWKNLDGMGHNFALLDGDGNILKKTEIMSEKGATQTIEFTATKEMTEYVCLPHITSMNGDISFDSEKKHTKTPQKTGSESHSNFEPLIPKGPTVRIETVADGPLTAPLDFGVPPGERDRFFVVDRMGQVYVGDSDGLREEPFIDLSDQIVEITGEMGLLGLAFHPKFEDNGRFYLRYSSPPREDTPKNYSHTEVLSEFEANEDRSMGLPDTERTLLEMPWPEDTHCAGAIVFGPDDYLYISTGDGGGAHDIGLGHADDWYHRFKGGNGQNVDANLLGSILRIDVDGREDGKPYAIPDSNPLVGKAGLDEHFAWGFRNPWRIGFSNGKLFAADVGQNMFEEVNIVEKGGNYGWNVREGTHCFKPGPEGSRNPPEHCPTHTPPDVRNGEPLIDPIIEYPHTYHDHGVGSAAIGGYLYENGDIPRIQGRYVFGDYRKTTETEMPTGSLFVATQVNEGQWPLEELVVENKEHGTVGGYVLAIGRDNTERLYVLTTDNPGGSETGKVHRIQPPKQPQQMGSENTTAANTTATNAPANTTTTNAPANTTATNAPTNTTTSENATATTATNTTDATTTDMTQTTGTTEITGMAETTGTETKQRATATNPASGTTGEGNGDNSTDASSSSGPGFGVVAALSALGLGAVKLLTGRDDE